MFISGIIYPSEEAVLQRQVKNVISKVQEESVAHKTDFRNDLSG